MSAAIRISPEETRQKVAAGKAMLVCAYGDDAKCAQFHLEGAIPLPAFTTRVGELSNEQEIFFYCN